VCAISSLKSSRSLSHLLMSSCSLLLHANIGPSSSFLPCNAMLARRPRPVCPSQVSVLSKQLNMSPVATQTTPHRMGATLVLDLSVGFRFTCWAGAHMNFTKIFGIRKRVSVFSHFGTIPDCDRQMIGHTTTAYILRPR